MRKVWLWISLIALVTPGAGAAEPTSREPQLARDVLALLRTRCVKCHGVAKREAKLDLSTPGGLARGGTNGSVVEPGQVDESLLWHRVDGDEMPPEDPLPAEEKALLSRWIASGAKGLPAATTLDDAIDHWAFGRLLDPPAPPNRDRARSRNSVDRFILAALEADGLTLNPEADRPTLLRRVSYDLTGLPPTPEEVREFVADQAEDAYSRMVERYLASPHYGERWGKYWLDAAGYADSNGYFNADTDRPLAYRYRDYVIRAFNHDKPFDRFVVEQIAGDELAGLVPEQNATPEMISLLEATHYLRNGPDGTGESDGNPDEVRVDRYSALESTCQIVSSSLLGLTFQCAKCHDHKFEPLSQREFYDLQSVFYPAFNVNEWRKPNERVVTASLPGEMPRWEATNQRISSEIAALRSAFEAWVRGNRPPSTVLFHDEFDESNPPLADNWSSTAPGDDAPAGQSPVTLDSPQAPAARRQGGTLQIVESGTAGDRWLSTRQAFDWTPDVEGAWIQVTFDLVADKVDAVGTPAARIAYMLALHDFNDNSAVQQGNVLIDGNPAGGAAIHLDYPGDDAKPAGTLGSSKYETGHNYGVRITRLGGDKFRLDQLIDAIPDEKSLTLSADDLPDGGFGFEYCCGRSFVVDNVRIERSVDNASADEASQKQAKELTERQKQLAAAVKAKEAERGEKPGRISCVVDRSESAPDVFLLVRGNYGTPGDKVLPAPLAALSPRGATLSVAPPPSGAKSTGRRLAWVRWLTEPGSRQASLMARVQANRVWQHHFGTGLVATTENLGVSGAFPSHPELLDHLAGELVRSGWSIKALHRLLLNAAVYRQTSTLDSAAFKVDPDDRLLWRFPLVRLDAEALRDAMLATSDQLDRDFGGPYVPTTRNELGEVLVKQGADGALRRSVYLQQRRTQTLSLLNVFDSPSIVFNCVQRPTSTMPLQSLSLLNSEFVVTQADAFATRLEREAGPQAADRVAQAYLIALAREPNGDEIQAALAFVEGQRSQYDGRPDAPHRAWSDFCQMLLASNAFLYVD
jgi:hypothetical protein